jgi:phytanoyl-CoA hydroxylase
VCILLQVPHQDSTFLYTDPPSCTGLWLALEDATRSNGCLWGLKGIHKQGLARRFKRLPQGGVGFDAPPAQYDLGAFEPIECSAGTLVLLHGANVHYRCGTCLGPREIGHGVFVPIFPLSVLSLAKPRA